MNLSKRIKYFRFAIFFYIFLLSITAAAQIVLGGVLVWGHLGYSLILGNNYWLPSTVQLCLGPATFIICWLGWNATSKKHQCQLGLFCGCLVIMVSAQFLICGWSLALRDKLQTSSEYHVDNSFQDFLQTDFKANQTQIWNRIQYELKCCGIHGSFDYRRTAIPFSCCTRPENPEDHVCSKLNNRGCFDIMSFNSRDLLLHTAITALVVGLIQSIGIFCVIQLTILIKRQPKDDVRTGNLRGKTVQELSPLSTRTNPQDIDQPKVIRNK